LGTHFDVPQKSTILGHTYLIQTPINIARNIYNVRYRSRKANSFIPSIFLSVAIAGAFDGALEIS
jgi:hypothetical protein